MSSTASLLERLEHYLDAAPRVDARAEDHGPLTLFVRDGAGYPYYARPRLGHGELVTARAVATVCARQRELGVPETFEYVRESAPAMTGAAHGAGLHVSEHPLLVLETPCDGAGADRGVRVSPVPADAPDTVIASAQAVARLGFSSPGTAVGDVGPHDLPATVAEVSAAEVAATRERLDRGHTVMVLATDGDRPVGVGCHQPVGTVSEIVGVATLPSHRRRGVAAAMAAALTGDARRRGCGTVFLAAGDGGVARVYERVGFRRVATSCVGQNC